MTDITVQAWRAQAAEWAEFQEPEISDLCLAAAEQREQLEAIEKSVEEYRLGLEHNPKQVSRKEIPMILAALDQQIATLTAENETLRHQWETTRTTLIDVQTYAHKQLATLTAERDALTAANKSLDAHCMVLQHDIRTCLAESDDEPRELLLGELSQQVVDLGLWNASQQQQIATLTARIAELEGKTDASLPR